MIPESVKIGGYAVKVVFVKNLMTDEDRCGCFSPRTMVISIDPDCCAELQYAVFCHELIEAIKEIYSIDCLKADHHPINQLGEALHQLLRDNGGTVLP